MAKSWSDKGSAMSPATNAVEVTPSDTVDLAQPARGIAIGAVGDLKILTLDGQTVTLPSGILAAGLIHPLGVKRVFATGTVATPIWVFA